MDGMPSRETIRRWIRDKEDFRANYARACEEEADNQFDDMQEIIQAKLPDDPDEAKIELQKRRLQVDTLKWQLSKRQPKKYGDKIEISGNSDNPLKHQHAVQGMTEAELDNLIQSMTQGAK